MMLPGRFFTFFLYLPALLLVIVYVNLFAARAWLEQRISRELLDLLPLIAALLALAGVGLLARHRCRTRARVRYRWLALGLILTLVALLLPDSRFPAKRFHVAEYLLLSAVIRFPMSRQLGGLSLLFFSFLATALLGIHDELLQGVHPLRTYGLPDMGVNALAAAAGSLFWHGMDLFTPGRKAGPPVPAVFVPYLGWLLFAVPAMVIPLAGYRDAILPLWPALPLIGGWFFLVLYRRELLGSRLGHGILVISLLSLVLPSYPLVINATCLVFH